MINRILLIAMSVVFCVGMAQAQTKKGQNPGEPVRPSASVGMASQSTNPDLLLPIKISGKSHFKTAGQKVTNAPVSSARQRIIPPTPFTGVLIGSSEWDKSDPEAGYYSFSATSTARKMIYKNNQMATAYGTLVFDGKLFTIIYFELFGTPFTEADVYDLSTGELSRYNQSVNRNLCATSLAYQESTGRIFGCFLNSEHSAHEFGELDIKTFTRRTISTLPGFLYALSFTPDGRLVGLNPRTGNLYEVNISTGALKLIGSTGITSKYASSGAVCPKTGIMYFNTCNDDVSSLYAIDVTTAKAEKLFDYTDDAEIMGMSIPMPPYADMAPAAATSLEVEFEGNDLSGNISFIAPKLTYDGTKGSGSLSYNLLCNDTVISSDSIPWGGSKTIPYSVKEASYNTFTLSFVSESNRGPEVSKSVYIGESVKPATVASVTLTRDDDKMSLSWTPVDSLFYGGEFNADSLSYTVRRVLDNKIVAEGLKTTVFTDVFDKPASQQLLSYEVIPVYRGVYGDPTATEAIVYGYLVPPFKETFAKARESYVKTWTILDADGDGVLNWTHDSSGGRMRTKANATSRDIVSTPEIYLEPDKIYTVKYGLSSYSSSKTAKVSCYLSDVCDTTGFKIKLVEPEEISTSSKTTYKYFTGDFSVEKAGFYYVGIKNEGGSGTYNYLDNVEIQAPAISAAPAAPSEFTAVADADGKQSVKLSFRLPVTTAAGDTIKSIKGFDIYRGKTRLARVTENYVLGENYTYTDTPTSDGITEYSVNAYNEAGHGVAARVTTYVGINVPGVVSDVQISEPEEGVVKLTWTAPNKDADGYPFNPNNVRYNILTPDREKIASGLKETSYRFQAVEKGKRDFKYYYVQTLSDKGESSLMAGSEMIAVGSPYEVTFEENFAGGQVNTAWANVNYTPSIPSAWFVVNETDDFPSADDDGGFVMSHSDDAGAKVALSSSKIRLNCEKPAISLYYFAIPESQNIVEIRVAKPGQAFATVLTEAVSKTGKLGWTRIVADLAEYKDSDIRVEIVTNCVNNSQTHLDAIRIGKLADCDLRFIDMEVPDTMMTNSRNAFPVKIQNLGRNSVASAKVKLFADNEGVSEKEVSDLAPGSYKNVLVSHQPSVTSPAKITYKVIVEAAGDEDLTNNNSAEVTSVVQIPDYPVVSEFSHEDDSQGFKINWTTPNVNSFDKEDLKIDSYNIYRDGKVLGTSKENSYIDTDKQYDKNLKYQVSVVYDKGESALSKPYTVNISGVADIDAENVKVSGHNGYILIEGAADAEVSVVSISGILLKVKCITDYEKITAEPGIYIVNIGKRQVKIAVK